jgi:hypothetical protein
MAPKPKASAPAFDPYAEWTGMPAFTQRDLRSACKVVVHFATDADADAFFELIDRPRKRTMWWPKPDGHTGGGGRFAYVADELAQAA